MPAIIVAMESSKRPLLLRIVGVICGVRFSMIPTTLAASVMHVQTLAYLGLVDRSWLNLDATLSTVFLGFSNLSKTYKSAEVVRRNALNG